MENRVLVDQLVALIYRRLAADVKLKLGRKEFDADTVGGLIQTVELERKLELRAELDKIAARKVLHEQFVALGVDASLLSTLPVGCGRLSPDEEVRLARLREAKEKEEKEKKEAGGQVTVEQVEEQMVQLRKGKDEECKTLRIEITKLRSAVEVKDKQLAEINQKWQEALECGEEWVKKAKSTLADIVSKKRKRFSGEDVADIIRDAVKAYCKFVKIAQDDAQAGTEDESGDESEQEEEEEAEQEEGTEEVEVEVEDLTV